MLGAIILRRGELELQVDVLHSVTGLTEDELNTTATITLENGQSYSVPAPDVMLKAKLANLETHDRANRQDERHVRILTHCCAHYLADTVAAIHEGELTERAAVDRFMATWRTILSAPELDQSLALKLARAIPKRIDLGNCDKLAKLNAFYDHQIEKRS